MTATCTVRLLARWTLVPAVALALVMATMSMAAPAQARIVNPDFFGMHDSQIAYGQTPGVSVGSIRLWDTQTSWRHIEPSKGRFEWAALDRAVETAEANQLRPMLVLGQTPRFHATRRNAKGAYGRGATSMPRLSAWARYVSQVAFRYQDRVDYQIWNEPNVVNYWTGSPGQMATLTAVASKKIRSQVEGAMVVAPAFPLRLSSQQKWYKKYWATKVGRKSMARYVNVVAANLYPEARQGPEAQLTLRRIADRLLPRSARRKPMWNTEINYGLRGGDPAKQISEARQAAYTARTLLLNAASSIGRVYWYSWDIDRSIANTHLSQSDGATPSQAGRAWDVVRDWINGTDVSRCARTSRGRLEGLYTCTARTTTEVRRIYWKPSGQPVEVRPDQTWTSSTDLEGATTPRLLRSTVTVGSSPVMVTSTS